MKNVESTDESLRRQSTSGATKSVCCLSLSVKNMPELSSTACKRRRLRGRPAAAAKVDLAIADAVDCGAVTDPEDPRHRDFGICFVAHEGVQQQARNFEI